MAYERIDDESHPDYRPPAKKKKKRSPFSGKRRPSSRSSRAPSSRRSTRRESPGYSNDYMRGVIDGMLRGGK